MSAVKLVAILNSFNRLSLLKEALYSLARALNEAKHDSAIVIFDAGSGDGSREWIRSYAMGQANCHIDLVEPAPGDDTSFSAGINAACRFAVTRYPELEWYFLFETDNWIAGSAPLQHALKLLNAEPPLAAAGFTVVKHSGRPMGYGCRFPTVPQFLLGQQLTHRLKLGAPRPSWRTEPDFSWSCCEVVYTSPILIRRSAWEASAGLDAEMFPFSDCDIDWAWRVQCKGWKLAVIESKDVVHDNREALSRWSQTRALHFHRGRFRLLRRKLGPRVQLLKPLLLLRHLLEWVGIFIFRMGKGDAGPSLRRRSLLIRRVFSNYTPKVESRARRTAYKLR